MNGLNDGEKRAVFEFLSALEFPDLKSLATTIGMGMLNPKDEKDALECIVLHSKDVESILRRKKITKEYIFAYLHSKRISVPASADKCVLIGKVLELWKPLTQFGNGKEKKGAGAQQPYEEEKREAADTLQVTTENALMDEGTLMTMAVKFTEWFCAHLNTEGGASLAADHFWNDAASRVKITSGGLVVEEEDALDGESSVALFKRLSSAHRLRFRPNLTPGSGLRARVEPHGAVLILACGSLHHGPGDLVGVYEQVFLLFRDPLAGDSWKVRRTEINLNGGGTTLRQPTALDGEFAAKYALTQSDNNGDGSSR